MQLKFLFLHFSYLFEEFVLLTVRKFVSLTFLLQSIDLLFQLFDLSCAVFVVGGRLHVLQSGSEFAFGYVLVSFLESFLDLEVDSYYLLFQIEYPLLCGLVFGD
jgi:hypothetical protein